MNSFLLNAVVFIAVFLAVFFAIGIPLVELRKEKTRWIRFYAFHRRSYDRLFLAVIAVLVICIMLSFYYLIVFKGISLAAVFLVELAVHLFWFWRVGYIWCHSDDLPVRTR